ncbi:hypothetical protein WA1_24855 [Scytonema hofmannii PCC 7110]|uniref:Uncharacterized protein n=1 Tax=Scytonema hofmannii PCC 7110 TaxID=128403 RepID=A0A139X835_9CYAN|nr:hypothetical protein [Scytonema hofmannii]KYC40854.1 hypothetical protein WA1_24855 [Scytonema hofmannii PCC 7110]
MTNTGQPPTTEERLSRLETLFANVGETVLAQNDAIAATRFNINGQSNTIDVLVANIQQLTENVAAVNQRVDALTINVVEVTNRVDSLAAEAAQDRQQAAIDRQEFRTEIRQIWEYLRDRNGGSSPL